MLEGMHACCHTVLAKLSLQSSIPRLELCHALLQDWVERRRWRGRQVPTQHALANQLEGELQRGRQRQWHRASCYWPEVRRPWPAINPRYVWGCGQALMLYAEDFAAGTGQAVRDCSGKMPQPLVHSRVWLGDASPGQQLSAHA